MELRQFLGDCMEENSPLKGLTATPLPPQAADIFLLGATASSAELAAEQQLPYVFALFLNGDEGEMRRAIDAYRGGFDRAGRLRPQAMLALPVIVADTEGEAAGYAGDIHVVRIRLESGRAFTVFSEEAAREFGRQSGEGYTYEVQPANVIHGAPAAVKERLLTLAGDFDVDEVFVVTAIPTFPERRRSYELLARVMLGGDGRV